MLLAEVWVQRQLDLGLFLNLSAVDATLSSNANIIVIDFKLKPLGASLEIDIA